MFEATQNKNRMRNKIEKSVADTIKKEWADKPITINDFMGKQITYEAGEPIHTRMLNHQIKEASSGAIESVEKIVEEVTTAINGIKGAFDNKFVEGFVVRSNGSGFEVEPVGDMRLVDVKQYKRKSSSEDESEE